MASRTATQTEEGVFGIELDSISPSDVSISQKDDAKADDEQPPPEAVAALLKWNSTPINKYRVFATFWSFLVVGMNDGSYGVSFSFDEKGP